jgi:glutathione S-transferase
MALQLFELAGRDDLRYSLFSWRSRLALAHLGLAYEPVGVPMHDKPRIAFSGGKTVPILVDGDRVVRDSWRIAVHLADHHSGPAGPTLLGDTIGRGTTQVLCAWVDQTLVPALVPMIAADIVQVIDPADVAHFRGQMEGFFGRSLEDAAASRDQAVKGFRRLLDPARRTLAARPFVGGDAAAYADHALFSIFQWARLTSRFDPLADDDHTLRTWRDAMLDAYGGVARRERAAHERGSP